MSPSVTLWGLAASPGVALGPAFVLDRRQPQSPRRFLDAGEIEAELERLRVAVAASVEQIARAQAQLAEHEVPEHALIFEAHRLMLEDPTFVGEAERAIAMEGRNAEWAIRLAAREIREAFGALDDAYFRERHQDIDFVADRLVRNLMGHRADLGGDFVPPGSILVAADLSPADAVRVLDPERVRGVVTEKGTQTSHTAILAHARGIPAVVGVEGAMEQIAAGEELAVDGDGGRVVLRPSRAERQRFAAAQLRLAEEARAFAEERGLPARTTDGHTIALRANIDHGAEVPRALEVGAEGVGLFRTEFLYLGRQRPPDEEEQLAVYRRVLASLAGAPLTVRVLDLGADKLPYVLGGSSAPNPALGLRGLRWMERHPDLLQAQLRAVLRASAEGPMRLLFPLVSGVEELVPVLGAWKEAKEGLRRDGVPFSEELPVGAMIEMPSAAWVADHIARRVDFFSIGTNDLIQYTLAIDRQNREVASLYRPLHPSVLRTIRAVVAAAEAEGIPVAVCGEMASTPRNALVLLGLGVRELSMTAGAIPPVRRLIRGVSMEQARALVAELLEQESVEAVEALVDRAMKALPEVIHRGPAD